MYRIRAFKVSIFFTLKKVLETRLGKKRRCLDDLYVFAGIYEHWYGQLPCLVTKQGGKILAINLKKNKNFTYS